MAQLRLYYLTELETKITLLPEQLDGNMDDHILKNLKGKVENRVIDAGIVIRVNRLLSYVNGTIDKSNFMGSTVIPVKYECLICSPIKDLETVCVLENNVKGFLIGKNGPLTCTVLYSNIDSQKFRIDKDEKNNNKVIEIKTKKELVTGMHLKVTIVSVSKKSNDKTMVAVCILNGVATPEEINLYNEEQMIISDGTIDDDKEFI